jgi:hypothetical protein
MLVISYTVVGNEIEALSSSSSSSLSASVELLLTGGVAAVLDVAEEEDDDDGDDADVDVDATAGALVPLGVSTVDTPEGVDEALVVAVPLSAETSSEELTFTPFFVDFCAPLGNRCCEISGREGV